MKRIFIFGCSFTRYHWPTWADIMTMLLKDNSISVECINLGKVGYGNVAIMHEIYRADIKYNFTDNDRLFIMWTSWGREDRFNDGGWLVGGSVHNNVHYDEEFRRRCWSIENDIMKNVTSMIAINKSYSNIIKFQCHGAGSSLEVFEDACETDKEKELFKLYSPFVPKSSAKDFETFTYEMYKKNFPDDKHPTILAQLKFAENNIAPLFNLEIKEKTSRKFKTIDKWIKTKVTNAEQQLKVYDLWRFWHKTSPRKYEGNID